jgi:hypothetical protein
LVAVLELDWDDEDTRRTGDSDRPKTNGSLAMVALPTAARRHGNSDAPPWSGRRPLPSPRQASARACPLEPPRAPLSLDPPFASQMGADARPPESSVAARPDRGPADLADGEIEIHLADEFAPDTELAAPHWSDDPETIETPSALGVPSTLEAPTARARAGITTLESAVFEPLASSIAGASPTWPEAPLPAAERRATLESAAVPPVEVLVTPSEFDARETTKRAAAPVAPVVTMAASVSARSFAPVEALVAEMARVKRRARIMAVVAVIAVAALVALAVLVVLYGKVVVGGTVIGGAVSHDAPVAKRPDPPTDPTQPAGIRARAGHDGIEITVDGKRRGRLPVDLYDLAPGRHVVELVAGDEREPLTMTLDLTSGETRDLGTISLEPRKVEVVVDLETEDAIVRMARFGEQPIDLGGPWPTTLKLEPGSYVFFVAKGGRSVSRPLHVSLRFPKRQLTLGLP